MRSGGSDSTSKWSRYETGSRNRRSGALARASASALKKLSRAGPGDGHPRCATERACRLTRRWKRASSNSPAGPTGSNGAGQNSSTRCCATIAAGGRGIGARCERTSSPHRHRAFPEDEQQVEEHLLQRLRWALGGFHHGAALLKSLDARSRGHSSTMQFHPMSASLRCWAHPRGRASSAAPTNLLRPSMRIARPLQGFV